MFNIKEIMIITSLSERTVRRYLESGKIEGTKVGGVWSFTQEQVNNFYGDKEVLKQIRREATQQVVDFINMPNPERLEARACVMIDLRMEPKVIDEVKLAVMNECKKATGTMTMKFLSEQNNYRFILIGTLDFIQNVTTIINQIVS